MSSETKMEAPRMVRVLCVGDDQTLFTALKRGLVELGLPVQLEWRKTTQEALDLLNRCVFDVVLSSLNTPGVGAPSALHSVRNHYPSVLRFILAGEKKTDALTQPASIAHQEIDRNTSARDLYRHLQTAVVQFGKIREERVSRTLSRLQQLPSRSAMMTDFLDLLSGQTPSLDSIASTVSKHPGMVAKVVKTANSPVFGQAGRIESLDDAINVLGLDMIASLFFSLQMVTMERPPRESRLDVEALWAHCVHTTSIVRRLGSHLRVPLGTMREAVTASLLHDIGKAVLANAMPTEFAASCTRAMADQIPLWQAEKPIHGNTHAEVGACLLRLWGFPNSLVDCVGAHHTPHRLGEGASKSVLLVHLADAIAHANDNKSFCTFVDVDYVKSMGVNPDINHWLPLGSNQ